MIEPALIDAKRRPVGNDIAGIEARDVVVGVKPVEAAAGLIASNRHRSCIDAPLRIGLGVVEPVVRQCRFRVRNGTNGKGLEVEFHESASQPRDKAAMPSALYHPADHFG